MKKITVFGLAILLLLSTTVIAADKVVVVPLISSKDPWIRIYDNNDQFVGFTHSLPTFIIPYPIALSTKNYLATFIPTSLNSYIFYPSEYFYYTTPDCSGNKYFEYSPFYLGAGIGTLFDVVINPSDDTLSYYVQYSSPPAIILPGATYSKEKHDTPCAPVINGANEKYLFEGHLNDEAITGFQNSSSYKGPFNYQYRLPENP